MNTPAGKHADSCITLKEAPTEMVKSGFQLKIEALVRLDLVMG